MEQSNRTVGEIVTEDYRMAKVFTDNGIDFCCGGRVSLADACLAKGLDPKVIEGELAAARATSGSPESAQGFGTWELSSLIDHIEKVHHGYLRENTGMLVGSTRKIAGVHGVHHPELIEIADIFSKMADDLVAHLKEEEEVLFPAVRRLAAGVKGGAAPDGTDAAKIAASLLTLHRDHEEVGDAVHAIRRLVKNYSVPEDGCATFAVTYHKLNEFEEDLHMHVHLENNILFPKAAQLCG